MFTLRFDMRAPALGAPTSALYAAAIQMCAWAEGQACLAAILCEHHGSEDGYLPAPLILASAIAARTERLALSLVVIIPLYEPVRLAEEMVVLDLISKGRASYIFGLGYRAEKYEHFGLHLHARGRIADEKLALLRKVLSGDVVIHQGRRIRVTPALHISGSPLVTWGGGSLAAARRAGRYGLGLLAQASVPGMQEAYEASCRAYGREPGPTLLPDRDTPSVCVADDVDAAWEELGPYLLHDAQAYAAWNPGNRTSAGISHATTVSELRAMSQSHRVFSVPEAITHVRDGGMLNLAPLCGGLPPDLAWPYFERVADAVVPALASQPPSAGAGEGAQP